MRPVLAELLTLGLALGGCGGEGLSAAERKRADAAYAAIARSCDRVDAGRSRFAHLGEFETPAERRRHAAGRRAADVLLALYRDKPQAYFAPPGERARSLEALLDELSEDLVFCDSTTAAKIAQALDAKT